MERAVFGASPVGLAYSAGLDPAQAALLQDVAARTWFEDGPFCDGSDGSLAAWVKRVRRGAGGIGGGSCLPGLTERARAPASA